MSWYRLLLVGTFLPFCWLAMQAVHELGHVIAALGTGGIVSQVVLHPLTISRTDLAENPHPLIVAWLGPLIGVLAPVGMLGLFKIGKFRGWYLVQFFAGFCLIANGVYIGIGSLEGIGDAGDLINHGSPMWCLWLFGLISVPFGFFLWNGLGSHFGLGRKNGEVSRQAAFTSCGLLISIVVAEVML
ncbi:MAG TPA: hypothetical protein VMM76_05485 [Pirellulaceae bacterium]|nr:hypothetical protein [Pirellulaceae bacterium]